MKNLCYESTSLCPLHCPYCISSDNGKLLKDNYEHIINFIGTLLPERVVISGGEPIIDPNLKKKIHLIKEKYTIKNLSPYISVSTSGACKIKDEMWDFLKDNIQCLDFSLPSLNQDTYKQMRGVNALSLVLGNIKKAVKKSLNVRISIIMTKLNYTELENLLSYAAYIGVNSVRVGRYFPFRNANNVKDIYELDDDIIDNIIDKVKKYEYSEKFNLKILPPIKDLNMMNNYLTVDFNGNLFIPTYSGKEKIGSVDDVDINNLNLMFEKGQSKVFVRSKE